MSRVLSNLLPTFRLVPADKQQFFFQFILLKDLFKQKDPRENNVSVAKNSVANYSKSQKQKKSYEFA